MDKWYPLKTTVDNVMTTSLETVSEDDSLEDCAILMGKRNCRHLLIKGQLGEFIGVISERDILRYLLDAGIGKSYI